MAWYTWLAAALVLFALLAWRFYNRFVVLGNRCDESWSNVGTELRRRHELVPNLVATVKGYAAHEQRLQQAIVEARALARRHDLAPAEAQGVERALGRAMERLLAVAEAYPDLKASASFLRLQQELAVTEDRIQAARRFYNGNVRDHRNATRQFPGSLFAALFKPAGRDFFEVDPIHAAAPGVAL